MGTWCAIDYAVGEVFCGKCQERSDVKEKFRRRKAIEAKVNVSIFNFRYDNKDDIEKYVQ